MLKLEIPPDTCEQMVKQAEAEAPVEACGILAGNDGIVEKLYKMINADKATDHFMMAPKEQFAVAKDIRSAGLEMLAIYHSHPETSARPSDEDIRLALTPDVIYVILSLRDRGSPAVKGFLIEDGSVSEVPVTITEGRK